MDSDVSSRIHHGTKVEEGEIPYQVLLEKTSCNNGSHSMCGGTLVEDSNGKQWIVTAAHCINSYGANISMCTNSLVVKAGGVDRRIGETWQKRNITLDSNHIMVHPRWKGVGPKTGPICDKFPQENCIYCFKRDHYGN